MTFEQNNSSFEQSQDFAKLFAEMYADATFSPEELQKLSEIKSQFEQEKRQEVSMSQNQRVNLSFSIENQINISPTERLVFWPMYMRKQDVLNAISVHPLYTSDKNAFWNLMNTFGKNFVQKLQIFSGIPESQADGIFGPQTFAAYRSSSLFLQGESLSDILNLYESMEHDFASQPEETRKMLQSQANEKIASWAQLRNIDGVFWPNTFFALLEANTWIHSQGTWEYGEVDESFALPPETEGENTWEILEYNSGENHLNQRPDRGYPSHEELLEIKRDELANMDRVYALRTVPEVSLESSEATQLRFPDRENFDRDLYNQEIWKEQIAAEQAENYDALLQNISQTSEYTEARQEVRSLSRDDIFRLQAAIGAPEDGGFGPETYFYYSQSQLAEAGFSITEAAKLKKLVEGDITQLKSDIQNTYNLSDELIEEIFGELSEGDYLEYDSSWGEMSYLNHETGEKLTLDLAEGVFDSISLAFEQTQYEHILATIENLSPQRQEEYIQILLEYIRENNLYSQARNLFSEIYQEGGITAFQIDFHGSSHLEQAITANDLFNDQDYLLVGGIPYIRRGNDFINAGRLDQRNENNQRLKIFSGMQVMLPTLSQREEFRKVMDAFEQRTEITDQIEWNLEGVLRQENSQEALKTILGYCSFASQEEKQQMVQNIIEITREKRIFANLRAIFTSPQGSLYTFESHNRASGVGDLFEKNISAFDLFGDYKTLEDASGNAYYSITEEDYTSRAGRLSLSWGTRVKIVEESRRTSDEFERINAYPQLAGDLWNWIQRNYVNNGNNSCGASVGDALIKFWIRWLPTSGRDGYRWESFLDNRPDQFQKVAISHPDQAKPGGICVFGQWAQKGTNMRRRYGHVEIKGGNNEWYSYYHSRVAAGSSGRSATRENYVRDTAFRGYVYYPKRKA